MSEFERPYTISILPFGSRSATFRKETLQLDDMRDTPASIKDKLGGIRAIVIHDAQILEEGNIIKNWFVAGASIIVVECAAGFDETPEWQKNSNQAARLLNAQARIDCALVALGRSYWQTGFPQFSTSATALRLLVEKIGTHDYQRRTEFACQAHPQRELLPVGPFNETTGQLMLPPILRGDVSGGAILGEWTDVPKSTMSAEERANINAVAARANQLLPHLNIAAKAVVRVFGYHALSHDNSGPSADVGRVRVVPFTAFFVSPKYMLSTRTAKYSAATETFALRFTFTRNVRAVHGMLQAGVDLFECKEVSGVSEFLVDSIRRIGVMLDDSAVPPSFFAAPFNDFMLLEVVEPKHYSHENYLLPELRAEVAKGEALYTIGYSARPSDGWVDDNFGSRGHNTDVKEDTLRRQWWSYDVKCCSFGAASVTNQEDCSGELMHTCSLLPGTRGAPILRDVHVPDPELDGTGDFRHGLDRYGERRLPKSTFLGISTGRAIELLEKERDNIIGMSTTELARVESLAYNMYNEASSVAHVCFILIYHKFIAPSVTNVEHCLHLREYLTPYDVLVNPSILSQCHQKMLQDAEDQNEYGMDFYDHHDLNNALSCFREGAKMFSTASIPNLSEHEQELRQALQTNVAAVVVAKMK